MASLLLALAAGPAVAGNGGFSVAYNSKIEKGELELMLMTDITAPSKWAREDGQGTYLSQMLELEYAPLSQLATEFMLEWFVDFETGQAAFTGFRWEARFRLFKKDVPLNPMIYAEYEDLDPRTRFKMETAGWIKPPYEEEEGGEIDRERILETRLVLSQDFGPVSLTVNWINETDLMTGFTEFGYAAGVMWMIGGHGGHGGEEHETYACPMHPEEKGADGGACAKCGMKLAEVEEHHKGRVGLGLEMYGGLGDIKAFGLSFPRQEHYLAPIIMYHITDKLMVHAQLAIGLSTASDHLVRLAVGYDF